MRIVARKTLIAYYRAHKDAKTALCDWYDKTSKAMWDNFSQLKESFRTADYVGNNRVIFNIKGGHYRLVALVLFKPKMLYIRFIGTHKEYENIINIENI